jgi:hypothetical protein
MPTTEAIKKYLSLKKETILSFIQEPFAVAFQLICLSRLGTGEITSNLVLFLTLVVFSGPFLNTWLMIVDHIFIKKDLENYSLRAIIIWILHGLGAALASWIADKGHYGWSQYIIWNAKPTNEKHTKYITWDARPTNQTEVYTNIAIVEVLPGSKFEWGTHIFEEMTGVLSLLIGCIYLLWLSENEKRIRPKLQANKDLPPLMDIQFYLRLTLLVASVSRAFPSAHLSFHISVYLRCMNLIEADPFWAHVVGGLFGLVLTIIFIRIRLYIGWEGIEDPGQKAGQTLVTPQSISTFTADAGELAVGGATLFRQNRYTPLRVSLQGGNYL